MYVTHTFSNIYIYAWYAKQWVHTHLEIEGKEGGGRKSKGIERKNILIMFNINEEK